MKAGLLIGHINSKANEDVMIRTAEALGINHIFSIGKKREHGMSMGGSKHVTFFYFKNLEEFINYAKSNNHNLVCLENNKDYKFKNIQSVNKYPVNPIFVTGNENLGVPEELLDICNNNVTLPQGQGYVRCLNTCVACCIVMYDWYSKEVMK